MEQFAEQVATGIDVEQAISQTAIQTALHVGEQINQEII
jgi:hypothetical protein